MSASRIKLEWRRLRCATPLKTKYCLHRGLFVLSAQIGAVHIPEEFFYVYKVRSSFSSSRRIPTLASRQPAAGGTKAQLAGL